MVSLLAVSVDRCPRRRQPAPHPRRHRCCCCCCCRSALVLLSSLLCLGGGGIGIGIGIGRPLQGRIKGGGAHAFHCGARCSRTTRDGRSNYYGGAHASVSRANLQLPSTETRRFSTTTTTTTTTTTAAAAAAAATADVTDAPISPASSTDVSGSNDRGAISTSISALSKVIGGTGRAKLVWDCYKIGIDPALFYLSTCSSSRSSTSTSSSSTTTSTQDCDADAYDEETAKRLLTAMLESTNSARNLSEQRDGEGGSKQDIGQLLADDATSNRRELIQSEIRKQFPTSRYGQTLGQDALKLLATTYRSSLSFDNTMPQIEDGIATLSHLSVSMDGTTKLLIRLRDGMEVESVIIPWYENSYSTLCISSQVGCRQACRFCATGRMGLLRSLTPEEILAQYFWATKICRLSKSLLSPVEEGKDGGADPSLSTSPQPLPDITNLVFMGMGEPADAEQSVNAALDILTDVELYRLSPSKVTVSTVAPSPEAFAAFADSPCVLAWSVHAANDELRRQLVPTTKHTMEELRQGLVDALKKRPAKLRDTAMLEVALINELNDGLEQADELADLALRIADDLASAKVMVNLIPFNDIGHPTYHKPRDERVRAFQERLWERGVYVHVRSTRGDDESAACGQLATKKKRSGYKSTCMY